MNWRKLHRKLAPILFMPLLFTALTGIGYRIGKSWLGLPDEFGKLMMKIHEGQFLGQRLVPVYVLLMGSGLLGLVASGLLMMKPRKHYTQLQVNQLNSRKLHQLLAPIAFLPFAVSALTGIAYRVGTAWVGLPSGQAKLLLNIHQGTYLGATLRPLYILFIGVSLVVMLISGIQMLTLWRTRHSSL